MTLTLVIGRAGYVQHVAIAAPGVTGATHHRLLSCVRREARAWHFPVRAGVTTAVLPYAFLRLDVPRAGPMPSCYSARGCLVARGRR
jgi:hypothetical protein